MITGKYSYVILFSLMLFMQSVVLNAQSAENDEAVVTIIGDPVQLNDNPYKEENNAPPSDKKLQPTSNNILIEPTLENGFHMRFELTSPKSSEHISAAGYSSSNENTSESHKKANLAKTSFNVKKRIKSWIPEFKKKYRPHLCGRF